MPPNGEFFRKLRQMVKSSNFLDAVDARQFYAVDGLVPKGIIFPAQKEEVSQIIKLCQKESLAVIPRGSGTKMGLGNIPRRVDLVLGTQKLDKIVDEDLENLTLTLEAGVVLGDIQQHLRQKGKGYFIPLDPPAMGRATLGGILATNSSGPKRFLYGTARDLVLGMKVIQPDGQITSFGGKTVKNVSGYDMDKLYIGSLGSLGVMVEATMRLLPLPEKEQTLLAIFSASKSAFAAAREIRQSQLLPSAVEVLSPWTMKNLSGVFPGKEGYVLAIHIEGVAKAVDRQLGEIQGICLRFIPQETKVVAPVQQKGLWEAIRDISPAIMTQFPESLILKFNVPPSKVQVIFAFAEEVASQGEFGHALWAHAGNGIVRLALLFRKMGSENTSIVQAAEQMTAKAVELEGNLTVEASPTFLKEKIRVWGREKELTSVFRQLKLRLDPQGLFNPGRFVGGI